VPQPTWDDCCLSRSLSLAWNRNATAIATVFYIGAASTDADALLAVLLAVQKQGPQDGPISGFKKPRPNSMASPFWDWIAARWAVRESNPRNRIPTPLSQQNHQATTTKLQTKATLVTGSPQNAVFYKKCTPVREPALQSLSAAHTEASAQAQQKHCGDHTANTCGLLCRTPTRYQQTGKHREHPHKGS